MYCVYLIYFHNLKKVYVANAGEKYPQCRKSHSKRDKRKLSIANTQRFRKRGHEFSEDNIYRNTKKNGTVMRNCRKCFKLSRGRLKCQS